MRRPFLAVPLFIDLKRQLHLTGKYFSPTSISTFLLSPSSYSFLLWFGHHYGNHLYICRFGSFTLPASCSLSPLWYVCVSAYYIFIHWPWQGANSWQLSKLRHYTICRSLSFLSFYLTFRLFVPLPTFSSPELRCCLKSESERKRKRKQIEIWPKFCAVWHVQIDLAAIELAVSSDHHFEKK